MSEKKRELISKKRNKLNLIDVLLIVFLVLIIGTFLAYRFYIAGDVGGTVYLQYSIEVPEVGEHINTEKLVGDALYLDGGMMGTVIGCSKVKTRNNLLVVGEIEYSQETVRYITVTVECEAKRMKNGGYHIQDNILSVGDDVLLNSNDFTLKGTCVQITEVIK